ncbi:MAG: helix-turn-helix transcriptional regulator [Planctomycetes bacterium]|nr:helix-turn-helix transcriptional regulator [Planctomycetota bacterium]
MNRFDIGRRIETYRDKLKMSTQELAERIGRSQATISRIENGKQGLTFELLSRIASELRVHPFALLSDEPLRYSVLLPPAGSTQDGKRRNLLANALQIGRSKRKLTIDEAAAILEISSAELESIELALSTPEPSLLEQMSVLYGLPAREMRVLRQFGEEAPEIAGGLARLQHVLTRIHAVARDVAAGEERRALERIRELLAAAETESPLPSDASSKEVGLFLNRLSLHLVNAMRDEDFRGKMFQMAGLDKSNPAPPPNPADEPARGAEVHLKSRPE